MNKLHHFLFALYLAIGALGCERPHGHYDYCYYDDDECSDDWDDNDYENDDGSYDDGYNDGYDDGFEDGIENTVETQPVDAELVISEYGPDKKDFDFDFGTNLVGSVRSMYIRITNESSNKKYWRGNSTVAGNGDFSFEHSSGSFIEPGGSGIYKVRFEPQTAGPHYRRIQLQINCCYFIDIELNGTGYEPNGIRPSFENEGGLVLAHYGDYPDFIYHFGNTDLDSEYQTELYLKNTGVRVLHIQDIRFRENSDFRLVLSQPCIGLSLAPGESYKFTVAVESNTPGLKYAAIEIDSNYNPGVPWALHLLANAGSTGGSVIEIQ